MNLVMLDIDGTLTQTCDVDSDCYVRAVSEISGLCDISTDWSAYRHTSDSGILDEIYSSRLQRQPSAEEVAVVQNRFTELMSAAISTSGHLFAPMPGVHDFIAWLRDSGNAVALASGGWQRTARMKLATAGLALDDFAAAFADDAHARADIMKIAHRKACELHRVTTFDKVTYLGDGVWDAKASADLAYRFIGIGSGDRAGRLRKLGAEVFADYRDLAPLRRLMG